MTPSEPENLLQLSVAPGHQEHLIIRLSLAPRRLQDTPSHTTEARTETALWSEKHREDAMTHSVCSVAQDTSLLVTLTLEKSQI